jgi:hypothetical protein
MRKPDMAEGLWLSPVILATLTILEEFQLQANPGN